SNKSVLTTKSFDYGELRTPTPSSLLSIIEEDESNDNNRTSQSMRTQNSNKKTKVNTTTTVSTNVTNRIFAKLFSSNMLD
ncbi:unnamed protein product, partial [Didymodactylos carnosus]